MNELKYSPITKMLFSSNSNGLLEPVMYNCKMENKKVIGTRVEKNSIYYQFIKYIRFSSTSIDKQTGEEIQGYFEPYQWSIAFKIIECAIELKSNDIVVAVSRQSKKIWTV